MSMEFETKRAAIFKMFACYPSVVMMDKDSSRLMLNAYLEKLETVAADCVDSACRMLSSRAEQFPPSAGVVFDKAREIEFKRQKADAESVPKLRYVAPFDRLSDAEREQRRKQVEAIVLEFKRGHVAQ